MSLSMLHHNKSTTKSLKNYVEYKQFYCDVSHGGLIPEKKKAHKT